MSSDSETLLEIRNASLSFRLSYEVSISFRDWLREFYLRRRRKWKPTSHNALKNVSFRMNRGEIVGVIGGNGAGKTTLLRLIAGVYPPDDGSVLVNGQVTAVLGLGVGFNPMLSGRANAGLAALLMGQSSEWVKGKIDEIGDFAGLGDFFDTPTRYYSTGMMSRLGFAVAVLSDPDILLIDETLSVGDMAFKKKAATAMSALRTRADGQIIVTHDLNLVRETCTRAIVMDGGKIIFDGDPDVAVRGYEGVGF